MSDSDYFRLVKNPGGNNYAISAVANALVRGELLVALLELKGGFDVQIHFLRQGLDRMRGAITESLAELQPEVRTLLQGAIQNQLSVYVDTRESFEKLTQGITNNTQSVEDLKNDLTLARFEPRESQLPFAVVEIFGL